MKKIQHIEDLLNAQCELAWQVGSNRITLEKADRKLYPMIEARKILNTYIKAETNDHLKVDIAFLKRKPKDPKESEQAPKIVKELHVGKLVVNKKFNRA